MSEEEQIILPDGFKRVEYLESSGTQWIQTDYCPCSETKIVSNCYFIKAGANGRFFGNGSTYNGGTDTFTVFMSAYTTGAIIFDFGNIRKDKNNYNLSVGKHTIIVDKNGIMVDGQMALATNHTITFQSTHSLSFFTAGGESSKDGDYWRIYDFIIYERGEVICHFIPCLNDDNEPCMYDLVSQKPFYNQGSGIFLTNKGYGWNYPLINNDYNLPAGFKKCVYLQSDGTQYIDLDVYPNNETGLFCKTIKLDNSNTSMFGVRENDSTAIMTPYIGGKTISYRWKAEGKDNIYTLDKAGDYIFSSFLNFYNDRLAKIDSEDTDWITILSGSLENYTRSIWLFSTNFQGAFNSTYGKYAGRIYHAQITQGDALIHDYVPCLDANGRPCMYDLIEQEALYNQSGGTEFAYCVEHQLPSDFVKLKYLEASGTQYIKTGYVPTNNTGLYVDVYCVIESGTNGVQSGVPMSIRQTNGNTYFSAPRLGKTSQTGYGWNSWTQVGGNGDSRYEGYLNWLNDKKYNVKSPLYVEKVGNLSNLSFTPTFDLCMFGNHNYDGKYVGSGYRIYRAKISEGSEIVRDFVPAFDELKLKPCMYDLINNVAYYNDGEGDFLYNRDVEGTYKGFSGLGCIGNRLGASEFEWKIPHGYVRVAFLESTGTQWMNTNYVPTTYSGVYVKYQATENSKSKNACWPIMSYDDGNHGIAPVTNRYGTSASAYWEIKIDPAYWPNNFSTDYIWEGRMNFYDDGITSMKVIKNGSFVQSFKMGSWGSTVRRFEYIPTDPFRICYVKWANKGVTPWKIYNVKITEGTELKRDYIPVIDSSGTPCMYDLVTKMPLHNSGSGTFVAGLETLSHALQLRLPNDGGTITLSLPINDNIEYYEEKIRANNPNWEITFYYH